jgi:GT2 family glycosyltransferase
MKDKLAIVILNKSNNKLLFNCLSSIKNKTKFPAYHIYIGDTGSSTDELTEIAFWLKNEFWLSKNVTLLSISPYNFAKNNNLIVKKYVKDESLIAFCNNDVELVDDCLTEAVDLISIEKNIGTVGFKLLFEDCTIQHASQLLFTKNNLYAGITHRGLKQQSELFNVKESVVGNTGALMVTPKELFIEIGGFNEQYLDCFEDVEYNLQCLLHQKQNVYIPKKAMHYESSTRNKNPQKTQLQQRDGSLLTSFINNHTTELLSMKLSTIVKI